MALQTETKPVERKMELLELVAYKRYHRGGHLYTDDNAYSFTLEQAEILLEEIDEQTQRPIWRRYKPKTQAMVQAQAQIAGTKPTINAVSDDVKALAVSEERQGRIDVGSDEEIADILKDVEAVEI